MTDQQFSDAKAMVSKITDHINSYSNKDEAFVAAMETEHRTLQQSFTRLCLKWLEHCASDQYRFDDRNAASHDVAKQIVEQFKIDRGFAPSNYLPFI